MKKEEKFLLYKHENKIVKNCNKVLRKYNFNNKDKQKKLHELFHVLTFLDISGIKYRHMTPNEPGDFIVTIKGKKTMIEVVRCFGKKESNKLMNKSLKEVFNSQKSIVNIRFNNEEMKKSFIKSINKKQDTSYNFDNKILLIVTAEYDNCSVTGSWFLKYLEKDVLDNIDNFDEIWVIDYFSSGKDNGPTVMTDLKLELSEYKKLFS